jgi:hypothetical protein
VDVLHNAGTGARPDPAVGTDSHPAGAGGIGPDHPTGPLLRPAEELPPSIWAGIRGDNRALAYLAAAVLGALIFVYSSYGKLSEIVAAEAVFFAGISLSLFVWGVTNAFNRWQGLRRVRDDLRTTIALTDDDAVIRAIEERVVGHIDRLDAADLATSETSLSAALLRWHERMLRQHDVLRNLAVLRRDLEAAYQRGSEFFDAQVEREDFHTDADQLIVILDDLNRAGGAALRVDAALRDRRHIGSTTEQGFVSMKLNQLGEISRDLAEALERRNHVYSLLFEGKNPAEDLARAREYFRVMTSDLRKAQRTIVELLDRDRHNTRIDEMIRSDDLDGREAGARLIRQQYRIVYAYAQVAKKRVRQVKEEFQIAGEAIPPALEILAEDVTRAAEFLENNWRVLMEEIGYDTEGNYDPGRVRGRRAVGDAAAARRQGVPPLPRSTGGQ